MGCLGGQKTPDNLGAEAYGQGHGSDLLIPAVEPIKANFAGIGETDVFSHEQLVADSDYHSEKNMEYLFSQNIDGYVADNLFRKRDPRFITQDRYSDLPTYRRQPIRVTRKLFKAQDYTFAEDLGNAICPAGKNCIEAVPM